VAPYGRILKKGARLALILKRRRRQQPIPGRTRAAQGAGPAAA
jgi:hypothetical protein